MEKEKKDVWIKLFMKQHATEEIFLELISALNKSCFSAAINLSRV
jgi:hypothetical protein